MKFLIYPIVIGALFISSCGYSLVGRGNNLPTYIKTVSIPIFKNSTDDPDLDNIITAAIRDAFIFDGRLKLETVGDADSTLEGTIVTQRLEPVSFDESGAVTLYNVTISAKLVYTDNKTGKKLLNQVLSGKWPYEVDSSITNSESLRLDAFKTVSEKMGETAVSFVIEAF